MPHSGYHRIVGFPRPFFEGWYFRVTLPEMRDNLSLIYHVYDPDLTSSTRRGAGAQACTPGGGYIYRESSDVDAFSGDPHALALRMTLGGGGDGDGGGGGARPSATQVSSLTTGQFVTTGLMSEVPIGLMTGGAGSGTRHKQVSSSEHGPLNESGASMSAGLQSQVVHTPHCGCG